MTDEELIQLHKEGKLTDEIAYQESAIRCPDVIQAMSESILNGNDPIETADFVIKHLQPTGNVDMDKAVEALTYGIARCLRERFKPRS